MVSLIYECLGDAFHGAFVARFLYLSKASRDIRSHLQATARLAITFPFEEPVSFFTFTLQLYTSNVL